MCKVMDDLKAENTTLLRESVAEQQKTLSLLAENKRLSVLVRAKDARLLAAIGRVQQIERNLASLKRWLIPLMKGNNGE